MTKEEAIKEFVARDLSGIPLDWVQAVAEQKGEEIYAWPMWGTMWILDFPGADDLYNDARVMVASKEDIDLKSIENVRVRARLARAIKNDEWSMLENYVDEEMSGARCVLDKDGDTTAMYIYEIDGQYVLGVNGAGCAFRGAPDHQTDGCTGRSARI